MTYLRHDDRDRVSEQLGVVREAQRVVTCPSAGHESDAHVLEQRVTCANRMHGNKNVWITGAIVKVHAKVYSDEAHLALRRQV